LTFEKALQEHSGLRNRAIANVFSQMRLIEAWGIGLQRNQIFAKEHGLPRLEFIEKAESFRVNYYRNTFPVDKNALDDSVKFGEICRCKLNLRNDFKANDDNNRISATAIAKALI